MATIETLTILALILIVISVLAGPLLKRGEEFAETGELSKEAEDLYRRKESTYSALKELEFDFKTGKLSRADFEELDGKYRTEALQILEELDSYESSMPAELSVPASGTCECGFVSPDGAKFCVACGEPFFERSESEDPGRLEQYICPECGAELQPHYRFCADCGLEAQG